jgi:hypothetical protein
MSDAPHPDTSGDPDAWLQANPALGRTVSKSPFASYMRQYADRLDECTLASRGRPPVLLTPLPRRTRMRLWCTSRIDGIAIWLCDHDRFGAAEALWRMTARRRVR